MALYRVKKITRVGNKSFNTCIFTLSSSLSRPESRHLCGKQHGHEVFITFLPYPATKPNNLDLDCTPPVQFVKDFLPNSTIFFDPKTKKEFVWVDYFLFKFIFWVMFCLSKLFSILKENHNFISVSMAKILPLCLWRYRDFILSAFSL